MAEIKDRSQISDDTFAFPEERKEPLTDAEHVRNAMARFNQVTGVSDSEKDAAWGRIMSAAKRYGVHSAVQSWKDLGKHSNPDKTEHALRRAYSKG